MKKNTVNTSITGLRDNEVGPHAAHIHNCLTGNANFTFTENELSKLATETETYVALFEDVSPTGTRTNTIEKNTAREVLGATLEVMGTKVNLQAMGDEIKLASSGFPLTKKPTKAGELAAAPAPIVRQSSNPGSIVVEVPFYKGVRYYTFYYTDDLNITDPTQMQQTSSSQRKTVISGLKNGVTYKVVAAYRNSNPAINYSPPVSIIAP